ncbi:DUF6153 family protein [Amycolatopsis coloradensis]|uniref:DUF6153 family protein n=1 Tax=Amycolatopsis coloradensis TaxID=76021 RepID=A0ACD5BJT7_9PSEU
MTRTARRTTAVRGRLAQLVAVLAVFVGLAFAAGLQCTEGMAMPMAHGMASAETHIAPEPGAAYCAPETMTSVDGGLPGHDGSGGTLATCLAFLFAVVAAVTTLPPSRLRGLVATFRRVRVVARYAVWSRAPRLEELCLLRT